MRGPKDRAGRSESLLPAACTLRGDVLICEHCLWKQRESCLFEEIPWIQREASGFSKLQRKSYFERPPRAGKLQAGGWSELRAESFLWQQMKVTSATVAGSCQCAGVPK